MRTALRSLRKSFLRYTSRSRSSHFQVPPATIRPRRSMPAWSVVFLCELPTRIGPSAIANSWLVWSPPSGVAEVLPQPARHQPPAVEALHLAAVGQADFDVKVFPLADQGRNVAGDDHDGDVGQFENLVGIWNAATLQVLEHHVTRFRRRRVFARAVEVDDQSCPFELNPVASDDLRISPTSGTLARASYSSRSPVSSSSL